MRSVEKALESYRALGVALEALRESRSGAHEIDEAGMAIIKARAALTRFLKKKGIDPLQS